MTADPSTPVRRLADAGMALPAPVTPAGRYRRATIQDGTVRVAGQVAVRDGVLMAAGACGREIDTPTGAACARQAALNALAALDAETGGLGRVGRLLGATVYVATVAGFAGIGEIADAASEVFATAFGPEGAGARVAVGVTALPRNSPVEVAIVAALDAR